MIGPSGTWHARLTFSSDIFLVLSRVMSTESRKIHCNSLDTKHPKEKKTIVLMSWSPLAAVLLVRQRQQQQDDRDDEEQDDEDSEGDEAKMKK